MIAAIREKLKGWKTVIVGAIIASPLTVLEILSAMSMVDMESVLPAPWGARLTLATSIAMILLRVITTGPVGAKGDEEPDADTKAGD